MSIRVGEVVAVHGTKVILKIDEQSSKETLFFDGEKYRGVSIREYLSIQRGFRDIICMVEGEYLDEGRTELQDAVPMTVGQEFHAFAASLDSEIQLLRDAGLTFVTVAELVRRRNAGESVAGLATISFDDGQMSRR